MLVCLRPKVMLKDFLVNRDLLLIGCGKMGFSILQGWLQAGINPKNIYVIDPTPSQALQNIPIHLNPSMNEISDLSQAFIVCAVKPQIIDMVLEKIVSYFSDDCLFLSIVAGVSLESLCIKINNENIIRAMPNTAASIAQSMTVLCASQKVKQEDKDFCETMMAAIGKVSWIENEQDMDAVTALSGSGPAYVFYMVEALTHMGKELGLSEDFSYELALQTVIGSGEMLAVSENSAAILRQNVTSAQMERHKRLWKY